MKTTFNYFVILALISASEGDLSADRREVQYHVTKLVSETDIWQRRDQILIGEIDVPIKKMNIKLFQHLLDAGVASSRVNKLKTDLQARTTDINTNYNKAIIASNTLMQHMLTINNHLVYNIGALTLDLDNMSKQLNDVQTSNTGAKAVLLLTLQSFKVMVNVELLFKRGEAVDAAKAMMTQIETAINSEILLCDETKSSVENTASLTEIALQNFIDVYAPL